MNKMLHLLVNVYVIFLIPNRTACFKQAKFKLTHLLTLDCLRHLFIFKQKLFSYFLSLVCNGAAILLWFIMVLQLYLGL